MSFFQVRNPHAGIRRTVVGLCAALILCLHSLTVHAQNLTLNLKGADINALIGTISEITGTNFIVDPRVKGKVTVISSRAIDSEEAYQVFLSILKVHGFAAIRAGDVVKIVPDATAKTDAIPNVTGDIRNPGDELITRVIQVDNVNAAQLVPILRPLIPQNGHLAAYPSSNVLIISDRAANIARLNQIIQRIDRAGDNDIEVIPLQYAAANEMVRIIGALHKSSAGAKGGLTSNKLTLAADQRTNSIILAGERSARLQARATIARLDTAPEVTGNTHVIYLKYAKAEDLLPVLTGLGKTKQTAAAAGGAASPARARSTKSFDIQADPATNALVITAQPDIYRSLQSVIRQLDIRRAQVLIEAIIAEVTPERDLSLGVQWQAANELGSSGTGPVAGTSFSNGGSTIGSVSSNPLGTSSGLSLGFIDGTVTLPGSTDEILNLALLVNAAAGDALTNILSTPTLVTLDNQEAEIVVADNVPIITGTQSNTSGGGDPFQTIERQDVGITLKVTPQINEGDAILLDVYQEVSGFRVDPLVSDIITNKRTINTHVVVDDKQVLVLGGLLTDELTESESSVPLLGDIPIIGLLFKSRSTTLDRKNLMVFLRPTILRESKDSVYHTNIRYNDIRQKQLQHRNKGVQLMSDELSPLLDTLDKVEAQMESVVETGHDRAPHTHAE